MKPPPLKKDAAANTRSAAGGVSGIDSTDSQKARTSTFEPNTAAFIHARLDEAGLSPSEFRVYCHVARRGECFASIETISEICKLHPETARAALKSLTAKSFLVREKRDGFTTLYRVTPIESWHPSIKTIPLGKECRGIISHPLEKDGGHPSIKTIGHPLEKDGDEVTPSEVTPLKSIPSNTGKLAANGFGQLKLEPSARKLLELVGLCKTVLGEDEMKKSDCHRRWVDRAETEPDKLKRVLADTRVASNEGKITTTPAQYAEYIWPKFIA